MHYDKSNIGYSYSIDGQPIEEFDNEKYFGVTFCHDLKASRLQWSIL